MLSITVLADNHTCRRGIACEHGLAVYAEVGDVRLLLDTGQSSKFLANADALGIDLSALSGVVISHGHYDHSGGLSALLAQCPHIPVFMHPLALRQKYSVSSVMVKPNGFASAEALGNATVRYVDGIARPFAGVTLFSLPADAPPNHHLMLRTEQGLAPDPFTDEVFALLQSNGKTILYGGCTHHGLPQLMDFVAGSLGVNHIDAFVGGLHLKGQPLEQISRIADSAAQYPVGRWIVNHCSGDEALQVWRDKFGSKPECGYAGSRINFLV